MKTKDFLLLPVAALAIISCQQAPANDEAPAAAMLDEARQLLAVRDYSAARDTILSLRRQHPTALDARRAAILTLDSVELMEARDSAAACEQRLQAARDSFAQMPPRIDGHTNDAYYLQQRRVMALDQSYDEICAKVKFFVRKIDIDRQAD
ncbi:MAG: hypothetical protein IJ767_08535 [Bacteroidaceae bacterium]|nr:hypothetical protein [Bacteroidaceae bacterium]MBR1755115.1 hypothetical protein [Bacteroidaceae bacterium]MBR1801516.1 hypothetical protein [Bacteroidaceae bacterium]